MVPILRSYHKYAVNSEMQLLSMTTVYKIIYYTLIDSYLLLMLPHEQRLALHHLSSIIVVDVYSLCSPYVLFRALVSYHFPFLGGYNPPLAH